MKRKVITITLLVPLICIVIFQFLGNTSYNQFVVSKLKSTSTKELTSNIKFNKCKSTEVIKEPFSIVKSANEFGIETFKNQEVSCKEQNIVISPLSIFTGLNVLSNGADKETKNEMKKVLKTENYTDSELNEEMNKLINYLVNFKRYEKTGFINLYNSIWLDDEFSVKDKFLNDSKKYYDAEIFKTDFSNKNAIKDMNSWISKKTKGFIENPIDSLDKESQINIFSVLHFKGKWIEQFNKQNTKKEKFYLKNGEVIDVNMMNASESFISYYENDEVTVGSLNYYNGKMIILIPKGNIDDFIKNTDMKKLDSYFKNMKCYYTNIKLPLFSIGYKTSLNSAMNSMGMNKAFMKEADFKSISDNQTLYVGSVLHDCIINVDEEGTEAAALTSVELCGAAMKKEIKDLYANRPFMFIIQGDVNDLNLFVGKVENPNK